MKNNNVEPDSVYFHISPMGSYSYVYIHDCSVYCSKCTEEAWNEKEDWTQPIKGSDSIMNDEITAFHNWETIDLYCSVCNENLPCEYGDTYETMVEFINNIDETSNEDDIEKSIEYLNVLNKNGYSDFVWDQITS
tara:strand:- start:359 stop:763 length:405 start_codon:yes stop_codon:yes gene_type:complete